MSNEETHVSDEMTGPLDPNRRWGTHVRGERVDTPVTVTVGEIRAKLPADLLAEFNERLENTPLYMLVPNLCVWGFPPDKLQEHRREYAENLYRSVCVNVCGAVIPSDLDVNAVIRNEGWLTEADAEAEVSYPSPGDRTNCGRTTYSFESPIEDELHGGVVVSSADEGDELRRNGFQGHVWILQTDEDDE